MFNITGGELLLILVMALIVLGPERLPDAARKIGKAVAQLRDLSGSFQKEIRDAFEEPATPVVKPNSRPQLTAIDGGAGEKSATTPLAAAPVDGGESLAVAETETSPPSDTATPAGAVPTGAVPGAEEPPAEAPPADGPAARAAEEAGPSEGSGADGGANGPLEVAPTEPPASAPPAGAIDASSERAQQEERSA